MTECNGWKNHQTWNVALWIGNEEPLYRAAVDYAQKPRRRGGATYMGFIWSMGLEGVRTPDNVSFSGTRLCLRELNGMIQELAND